jgi:hypothetical protein
MVKTFVSILSRHASYIDIYYVLGKLYSVVKYAMISGASVMRRQLL